MKRSAGSLGWLVWGPQTMAFSSQQKGLYFPSPLSGVLASLLLSAWEPEGVCERTGVYGFLSSHDELTCYVWVCFKTCLVTIIAWWV